MTSNDESMDQKSEREADVDRLYKKMSVERHEKLKKDMRDLVTKFRMRAQKYEDKVNIISSYFTCISGFNFES